MTAKIGLMGLALLAGMAGCGQTSFFEVTVMTNNAVDFSMINSCEVAVSGAATESFTLDNCGHVVATNVGKFQYGTAAESGTVNFHVVVKNGNLAPIGQGDVSGAIKAGGRQALTVNIAP